MKNTLDTLQDVLLMSAVILLVYVLYKRLLRVLGKEEKKKKYPVLGERITWITGKKARIDVKLEERMSLSLEVFTTDGTRVLDVLQADFEAGDHHLDMDCSQLSNGRYYLKLVSPKQEASQYFELT